MKPVEVNGAQKCERRKGAHMGALSGVGEGLAYSWPQTLKPYALAS